MTDEEKVEDFVKLKICGNNKLNVYCPYSSCSTEECVAKVSYLAGLAEGRKELEQWKQEWQDAQIKANEEGFARTTLQIKYSKLEKENAELKAQIEKMKCCKEDIINSINSENADIEWVKAHNGVAKFIYVQTVIDIINNKWELVE